MSNQPMLDFEEVVGAGKKPYPEEMDHFLAESLNILDLQQKIQPFAEHFVPFFDS